MAYADSRAPANGVVSVFNFGKHTEALRLRSAAKRRPLEDRFTLPKDSPRARLALSWQRFGMVFGDEILSAEEIAELILMDEFDLAAPRGIR
jgi:hypothetical protein